MNTHQKHSATGQVQAAQPGAMTDAECLDEVATILAVGLLRLRAKPAVCQKKREISRDNCLAVPSEISPDVAGH